MGFVSLLLIVTVANSLFAQEKPAPNRADSEASQRDYRFEVASIRPTEPQGPGKYGTLQPFAPGHYHDERISLAILAWKAFDLKQGYQIQTPSWMSSDWFSVNATVPNGATKDDLPIMLRHLLADRFELKYHREIRQMDGYELVVAKSGPRLTPSGDTPPQVEFAKGPAIEVKNGVPQFSKDAGSGQLYYGTTGQWRGRNRTMQSLASDLSSRLHLPVMDATHILGEYDYMLTYTTGDEMYPSGNAPPANADAASTPLEHPLLRDALREQLGLELRPVKNVPIDVIVIDSANQVPTEN